VTAPIWIGESDVQLGLGEAIALLRQAMNREANGRARNMDKTHVQWDGGTMHAIGAVFTDCNLLGVKTWAHTAKGATPLEILWDAENGKLLAVIEAFAMGQLRTAGMAGLATDCLAAKNADLLAICGTGKQALAQVAAVQAVRPLRMVRVYGRDQGRSAAFAARVESELGVAAESARDVLGAVKGAPIITLITRAKEAFLMAEMPSRGTHINAMGAITPERQEFESALLDRCTIVATDSVKQAHALSSELIAAFGDDFSRVQTMSQIVSHHCARPEHADLTLFKSLGVGIADLALAEALYRMARERGTGTILPAPVPVPLTFSRGVGHE